MTTTRRRKASDAGLGKPTISREPSPVKAYRALVSHSSTHFRADVEFHEKPRQIIMGILLLITIGSLSVLNADAEAQISRAIRTSLFGLAILLTFYSMLQSKDGLMLRPHPMLWRAVHGITLTYVVFLVCFVVIPPKLGIKFLHDFLLPDIAGGAEAVFQQQLNKPIPHLDPADCAITMSNVMRQLTSIWFIAHVLGWWGKMCLIRDWTMCLQYSIAFEVVELSLVWMIPEFQECWWDSLFMDVLGANMIGLFLGSITLKWLSCRNYEWEPENKNRPMWTHVRSLLRKFTPFSWSEYIWPSDSRSWLLSCMVWVGALAFELNTFILIHGLVIRPSHWFHVARLMLLGAQGAQAVPEWYEYVRGNIERIGHNSWLILLVGSLEMLIGFRYGKGGRRFEQRIPPLDTVLSLSVSLFLWIVWYVISAYRGGKGKRRSPNWLVLFHVVSFLPLLFLTRRWVF